jgi:hypothetical protein
LAEIGRSEIMASEFINVAEALKLVSPFNGNKKEVLTFVSKRRYRFQLCVPSSDSESQQEGRGLRNSNLTG